MLKTITLTGTETAVNLGIVARNIRIENRGSGTVYASAKSGIIPKADGVLAIAEGETKTLHDLSGGVLYLLGTGDVEIEPSDGDFNVGGKGGDLSLYDNHLIARTVDVWSGMSSPYTCEIPFVGVAAESVIDVIFDNTVTVEQIDAWVDAEIKRAVTSTNKVTLYAYGKKPAIEIPVVLVKRGGINAG